MRKQYEHLEIAQASLSYIFIVIFKRFFYFIFTFVFGSFMCNTLVHRSEEIFDFGSNTMTQGKIKELKQAYNSEFSLIFQVCVYNICKY
jgi:uncharacterized protein YacL